MSGSKCRKAGLRPLLITDTDLDGSCCAFMVKDAFPEVEIKFESHATVNDRVKELADSGLGEYDLLIIADMLPDDKDLVTSLHNSLPDGLVRIYDHHENQEYLNDLYGCRHDFDRCSGLITAHEMRVGDSLLEFAKLVDVWDRYVEEHEDWDFAYNLNLVHKFLGQQDFISRGPTLLFDEVDETIIRGMRRKIDSEIKQALENVRKFKDAEGRIFAFGAGFSSPAVAHAIYTDHDDVDYVVMWQPTYGSVSLYSKKGRGEDVSKIARSFGGGGHENASGFTPKRDLLKILAGNVFCG